MSTEKTKIHSGGCHCGAVRYLAKGRPVVVAHCHCEDCQRLSGTGHTTGAMFEAASFQLTGQIAEYSLIANNGNRVTRVFCPNCASPIFGRNSGTEGYLTISLGTFDDSSVFQPQVAIFARNRKPWDKMDSALPIFEAQPDWDPADGVKIPGGLTGCSIVWLCGKDEFCALFTQPRLM